MDRIEEKDLDIMYAQWLESEQARNREEAQWRADENTIDRIERSLYEAAQSTSWAQAIEGLEIPQRESRQETEMER